MRVSLNVAWCFFFLDISEFLLFCILTLQ
jgi:hypothetical protein